jgi:hypothetical protein
MGHNLTINKIIAYPDGTLVEVKRSHVKRERQGGGIRGKITGFSNKSRRNLMKKLGKVNKKDLPLWVTLTYPDEFDVDIMAMRKHFERFRRRLDRRGWSGIWRVEWVQRKSGLHIGSYYPHYHLLIWGVDMVTFRAWVANAWWECCGKLSEKHFEAGTSVDNIHNWKQLCCYVSKYMAKTEQLPDNFDTIGRLWGVINPSAIPWAELLEWTLPNKAVNQMFRMMRRYAHIKTFSGSNSLSILCNSPGQWLTASLRIQL